MDSAFNDDKVQDKLQELYKKKDNITKPDLVEDLDIDDSMSFINETGESDNE